jgi:hypothetical protein
VFSIIKITIYIVKNKIRLTVNQPDLPRDNELGLDKKISGGKGMETVNLILSCIPNQR